jgi:protein-S-isoprenylcysteine O-methyltransferase Ste14
MSFVTTLLAETEHVSLPMPTWAYGLIALVIFIALGVTLWTYRDVSNRHSEKAAAYAKAHGNTSGHSGH